MLVAALVIAAVAGCGGGTEARSGSPTGRTPVVVDTDMSTDDILALLYLAQRDDVDIRAVTVSGTGVARCPQGAANALALLAQAGRGDVPVACGRADPLAGFNAFPAQWRDAADAFYGLRLPPARRTVEPGGAEVLLRSVLGDATATVTVLSLAPMTNTAAVLRADPAVRSRIGAIYAMAGAVGVPGNIGPGHEDVEYNVWVDPTAARIVLAAGVPVTLVPLDATNDVPITPAFATALRRHHDATPAAATAWSLLRRNAFLFAGGQYFWDPLAATAVTQPGLLRFEDRRLAVATTAGAEYGRVVAARSARRVRVAVGARRAGFENHLLTTLLGGRRATIARERPTVTLSFDGRRCTYRGPRRLPPGRFTIDTVDRGGAGYRLVAVRLYERRTIADLRAAVTDADGRLEPSTWVSPSVVGDTPPNGRLTWLGRVDTGPSDTRIAVACVGAAGTTTLAPVLLAPPR
ncbi:MAG TPA: nucleoside hydrolase [Solirubrobacteraceae bacterium]|nr:nucleoside hydrolase [Solirubrobacteraceae bacterium]